MFAGLVNLTLSNPQPDILSHPWSIPPHLQASDNPTGLGVGLFVSVPDKLPTESMWAYDTISLLLLVVCRKRDCQEAACIDLEEVPAVTEQPEFCIPLALLLFCGFLTFLLCPEDIRDCLG